MWSMSPFVLSYILSCSFLFAQRPIVDLASQRELYLVVFCASGVGLLY